MVIEAIKSLHRAANKSIQGVMFDSLVKRVAKAGAIDDLNRIYDYMARANFGVISAIQEREELIPALKAIKMLAPKVMLEIGTANGGSLFTFTRVVRPDATIISLDLPGGNWGGGYSEKRVPLYQAFALPGQDLHLLRDDSHQQRSLDRVKEILAGRTVDFLFIDGDHSYEGVAMDYAMYSPLVTPGGLIGFHDTVYAPGVQRFWAEVSPGQETQEFIAKGANKFGIGLLRTPQA